MENLSNPNDRDQELWKVAKKRAGFKTNFFIYLVVNAFFWVLWWIGTKDDPVESVWEVWPIWPMLGWGIGIAFQYWDAYKDPKGGMVQKEYEKLRKERGM